MPIEMWKDRRKNQRTLDRAIVSKSAFLFFQTKVFVAKALSPSKKGCSRICLSICLVSVLVPKLLRLHQ